MGPGNQDGSSNVYKQQNTAMNISCMSNISINSIHNNNLSFICWKLKSVNEFHYLEAEPICKQINKINIVMAKQGSDIPALLAGI